MIVNLQKHVLEKDVQNIASKQIFARWQAILSVFNFDIEFIEGTQNNIPDFLTYEFLQSLNHHVGKKGTATPIPKAFLTVSSNTR